ncbi:hypothetical protein TSUD_347690 [Trifolium subterraneum]|nr:hypothetical protein TSUD_347690 [Trifolium subterraneum]
MHQIMADTNYVEHIYVTISDHAGLVIVHTILLQLFHVPFLHLRVEAEDIYTNLNLRRRARALAERSGYMIEIVGRNRRNEGP